MDLSSMPKPIEVTAFEGANARSYLRAVFEAYRTGRVVLALPPGAGRQTVPGTKVLDRQSFEEDPGWFEDRLDLIHTDAAAQIAFSSGTTGRPKALLLSHRALSDVVARINEAMQVDDSIREYIGVPVTFSFGFGRARAVAAAGGKAYLPPNGFDPAEIGRMLSAGEINAISAVPTLWRVLLANPSVIGTAGADLRWIEIGSQYMSGQEKAELKALFPNAKIVQHYGLTEASRSTLLDISATTGDALESVGAATGDCAVSISDEGLIRVRGPHLAMGVVGGAGVKPITDADGWLTTADRGQIRDGLLYYEGRIDELINCGGVKIDPTRFEQQLGQALGLSEGIAVGRIADSLRGEQVLIAVAQDSAAHADSLQKVAVEIAESYGLTRGALSFRTVADIPKTATGKVKRAELPDLPDLSAAPAEASADALAQPASRAAELQALWAEVLGVPEVSIHESFYDLGGDSLSALTVIMRMEALGLDPDTARMIFDGKTIAEITGAGAPQTPAPAATPAAPAEVTAGAPANPRAAELQALWAEVLGVPEVSIHESFYDLGGDSLSALTVIMRMEALGLDPDTARMIFDGKTIAEITGAGAPQHPVPAAATPVTTAPADTSADPRAAELQALWAEVLGVPEVSIHESFYDLGGDSLSALTVIMRMEALGLDPDTARMIFDGKTIAEITAAGGGTAAPPPAAAPPAAPVQPMPAPAASAPEAGGLTFPEMMNAVHATRGVLILWVVVVHWLPGALERISQEAIWIYDMLYPALRYGTPGFAMVFGLGIGALGVYHYAKNPAQFLKGNRFNTRLILGGVLFMALFRLLSLLTGSGLDDAYSVSFMFYSAIAYYALAMLTMPLLMRLLQIGPDRVLTALTIGAICLLIHEGLSATIAPLKPGGVLELAKILLTAKYGYFHMTSYVMVGVVMGLLLRQFHHRPRIAKDMLLYGTVLIIFGFVMLYEVRALPGLSDFGLVYPWHLMIYAGLTLWIIAAFCALNRGVARHGSVLRLGNSFAIASGILALPIFVGHEVVIPAKAVLVNLGMSDALGLIVPLAVFLVALGLGYQRLMKFLIR